MQGHWPELIWHSTSQAQPHEAALLHLDSAKAQQHLGWRPVWRLKDTIRATADWYRGYFETGKVCSAEQLDEYLNAARTAGLVGVRHED